MSTVSSHWPLMGASNAQDHDPSRVFQKPRRPGRSKLRDTENIMELDEEQAHALAEDLRRMRKENEELRPHRSMVYATMTLRPFQKTSVRGLERAWAGVGRQRHSAVHHGRCPTSQAATDQESLGYLHHQPPWVASDRTHGEHDPGTSAHTVSPFLCGVPIVNDS